MVEQAVELTCQSREDRHCCTNLGGPFLSALVVGWTSDEWGERESTGPGLGR